MTNRQQVYQFKESTIEMIAKKNTSEQFFAWCHDPTGPLEMLTPEGDVVSGPTVFRLYRQYCLEA